MSVDTKRKSFFTTTAGFFTGLAGVLTAIVGLLGLAAGQGWIGSRDDSSTTTTSVSPTPTTASPGLGGLTTVPVLPGGSTGTTVAASGPSSIRVSPTTLEFDNLGPKEKVVRATNDGRVNATLSLSLSGQNAANFAATPVDASCSSLVPGQSCDVKVTFTPRGAGQYSAKLVIQAGGTAREVPLQGSALL